MKVKIYCPVCRVHFLCREPEPLQEGVAVLCTVCGAMLEVTALEPGVAARRFPMDPGKEIRDRVEAFARLRGYVFNEDRETVLEGLIEKHRLYGDFYCPCRFDNVPENVCPCLETRMNRVRKDGNCF